MVANFNIDGPEVDYFGQFVQAGQPALDAACGTGRLLVPWVSAGLDGFGLGSTREQDVEALRRLFAHLDAGGLLALTMRSRSSTPTHGGRGVRPRRLRHHPGPRIVASAQTGSSMRCGTGSLRSTPTPDR